MDTEIMLGRLTQAGWQVVETAEAANLLLVNTCGVIQEACQEAVDTILELARHKEADPGKRLAVTGFPRPQAAAWERKFWPKLRLGTLIYL